MKTETRHAQSNAADADAAKDALDRADAQELHAIFQRTLTRYAEMEDAMTKVVSHYLGAKDEPRYQPNNDNAIASMERIAMEALTLARYVVEQVAIKEGRA